MEGRKEGGKETCKEEEKGRKKSQAIGGKERKKNVKSTEIR